MSDEKDKIQNENSDGYQPYNDTTYRLSKKDIEDIQDIQDINDNQNNEVIKDKKDTYKDTDKNENDTTPTYSFWAEQIAASNQSKVEQNDELTKDINNYNNFYSDNSNSTYSGSTYKENNDGDRKKKPNFITRLMKGLVCAAVFGIIAGAAFVGFNGVYYHFNPNNKPIYLSVGGNGNGMSSYKLNLMSPKDTEKKLATTTVSNEIISQKTDVTDVIEHTMPSIVTINSTFTRNYQWFGQQSSEEYDGGGSGIIVDQTDKELLIATNNHVVEGSNSIVITFIDDSTATAIIKGTDAIADLAVLSIDKTELSSDTLKAIKTATLGDSEDIKVGQMVVAIGNALGYGQSTTVGYVSAKDREVSVADKVMVLLQTDAAINPGNSGGALINMKGEVIGINTVKYASSEVEGMGFAIPISRATPILDELKTREIIKDSEKGFLGVSISEVTEEVSSLYNWPVGVYVRSLLEGGAAEKYGVKVGDIIVGVNDVEITASTQLQEKVSSYRYGTEIKLNIMRNVDGEYVKQEIMVVLGKNTTQTN